MELLANVTSQKSQEMSMFGSDGFEMEGSTMAGPGLSRKVSSLSSENKMRPPASWGIVTVIDEPLGLNLMIQFLVMRNCISAGESG